MELRRGTLRGAFSMYGWSEKIRSTRYWGFILRRMWKQMRLIPRKIQPEKLLFFTYT